jgi:hypothetical protein
MCARVSFGAGGDALGAAGGGALALVSARLARGRARSARIRAREIFSAGLARPGRPEIADRLEEKEMKIT